MKTLMKMMMALAVMLGMGLISQGAMADGDGAVWDSRVGGTVGGAGTLLADINTTTKNTAGDLKNIIYGGSAMGALALGVLAFFGRFQWVWFFGLIGGLVLIAGINLGITYLTGEDNTLANNNVTARGGDG